MASYMFLMQLGNSTLTDYEENALVKMTVAGCGFSLVGTMLSLCLICFLPVFSDGMFILTNLNIAIIFAQLAFIGAENSYQSKLVCKTATAVLHYTFLVLQFCSLAFGLHLLSKLKPDTIFDQSHRKSFVMLLCWGIPFLVVGLTAVLRGDTYGSENLCWLTPELGTRWAFVGPVLIIQLINLKIFITIMSTRFYMDVKRKYGATKVAKNQLLTALSLIPVLGLMWSLGFSASLGVSKILQYMFVALCSTQGILIFLGHVLTNEHVRKSLCIKLKPVNREGPTMSNDLSEDYTNISQITEIGDLSRRSSAKNSLDIDRRFSEADTSKSSKLLHVPDGTCRQRTPRSSLK